MEDTIANQVSAVAKWGGVVTTAGGALTFNEYLALGGFIVAAVGTIANVLINWYYKHQQLKLDKCKAKENE